jgi:hypothetical protein
MHVDIALEQVDGAWKVVRKSERTDPLRTGWLILPSVIPARRAAVAFH